ncbi:MAG TPA: hypothetical protein VFB34_04965 [Chloroflexota bacterium]|nr:hypothetical protein [Chloroflexota bacterium]
MLEPSKTAPYCDSASAGYRIAQGLLFFEGRLLGFAGLLTAFVGFLISVFGGSSSFLGLAVLVMGCAAPALATSLWLLADWISGPSALWYRISTILQVIFATTAILALNQIRTGRPEEARMGRLPTAEECSLRSLPWRLWPFRQHTSSWFSAEPLILSLRHLWRRALGSLV